MEYIPYGEVFVEERNNSFSTNYLFNAKELDNETGLYYYGARYLDPTGVMWLSVDPLFEKYAGMSPYNYCAGNPVKLVDPDGNARKPSIDIDGSSSGYIWIDPEDSYDSEGNLCPGLYEQAIFFSRGGKEGDYNGRNQYNMGTSIATVYKSDGTIEEFDACTYPAKTDNYPTVPQGLYQAYVGKHQGKYTALKMEDVGSSNRSEINLGCQNPAKSKYTTKALGINIHHAGVQNLTGMTSKGTGVSEGCLLIDNNQWDDFISIFDTPEQKGNIVSVTVSRTMSRPSNSHWEPLPMPSLPNCVPDALNIINTRIR